MEASWDLPCPASDVTEKREHFRIRYPVKERPLLLLAQQEFEIIDMCEEAVKFRCPGFRSFSVGDLLEGGIRFRNGESMQVEGKVLRVDRESVVMVVDPSIPCSLIVSEQRRLANKYLGYR